MGATSRLLDALIEAGLLALLLFAPLPFGAVDPWAGTAVVGAVAGLVALVGLRMLAEGQVQFHRGPLLGPALVALALGLLQLRVDGSINPHATGQSLRLLAAYVGLGFVLATHLVTRARVLRLLWFQVGLGTALALLGLANRYQGRMLPPWFPVDFVPERLVSTFVNPNHQALYFAITFFLALALLLRPRGATGQADQAVPRGRAGIGRWGTVALLATALAGLGVAIALTVSRGGFAGMAAGLVAVCVIGLWGHTGRWTIVPTVGIVVALVLLGAWFGFDRIGDRIVQSGRDPFADYRWAVWARTVGMIGDAPVLGSGLGTYQDAFPAHRPPGIQSHLVIDYAHNDYLQLAVELGMTGLVVAGWALIGLVVFVLPRWRSRHDPFVRGVVLGGLGALAAVAAHSVLDFGLHMPANALLAVVVGVLLPNVVTLRTRRGSGGGVDLPAWQWTVPARARVVAGLALVGAAVAAAFALAPIALADWHVVRAAALAGAKARAAGAVTLRDLFAAYQALEEAARLDRGNPSIHSAVAEVAEDLALRVWNHGVAPDGRRLGPSLGERVAASQPYFTAAYVAYERSLDLRPRAAQIHDRYGRFLGSLEQVRQVVRGSTTLRASIDSRLAPVVDSLDSLIPVGLRHMREGVRLDPLDPYHHRDLGLFALTYLRSREGLRIATEEFRTTIALEPALLGEIVDRLEAIGAPPDVLTASLPRREDVWFALGQRYDRLARRRAAASAYEEALGLTRDPAREVDVRLAFAQSLLHAGTPDQALTQARRALVLAPRRPEVFGTLAEIYAALKQRDATVGAFDSAIALSGDVQKANWYRDRLASFYEAGGELDQAVTLRRQMLHLVPGDLDSRYNLARVLALKGLLAESLEEYQAVRRARPDQAGLHAAAARVAARLGRLDDALEAYEAAVKRAPDGVDLRMELGELLGRRGSRDRAIEQYQLVLTSQPGHEGARRALGALSGQTTQPSGR